MNLEGRMSRLCRIGALLVMLAPVRAFAHVKWFCTYDVTKAPAPIHAVLSGTFLTVLAAFLTLLFLGFLADGWVAKQWPRFESSGASVSAAQEKLVRLGMGAFFLCTWNIGLNILTPELHTQAAWIFGVQFVTAICTAWRRTCVVSALGIVVLYLDGITQYGFFHMLDYVYFLGLAFFLAAISLPSERMRRAKIPTMIGCLAFSLMWTAIEKLLYPEWSQQLMVTHGHMMMGLPFHLFIVIAAFVEFTLSFYLATGRGLLRFGALALLAVFVSAMPEFGPLDVVGHFPLVAILGVPLMAGDSALQRFWRLPRCGILGNAAATCALYVITLAGFLGMYYGVQWVEYRTVSNSRQIQESTRAADDWQPAGSRTQVRLAIHG